MRHTAAMAAAGLFGALLASVAMAAPETYDLPDETTEFRPSDDPGFEVAQNNCAACHSADYIDYQPPGKGRAFWEAEVHKMIAVYGAPIDDDDARLIVDYLANTY